MRLSPLRHLHRWAYATRLAKSSAALLKVARGGLKVQIYRRLWGKIRQKMIAAPPCRSKSAHFIDGWNFNLTNSDRTEGTYFVRLASKYVVR
jgi:hypothetical protein